MRSSDFEISHTTRAVFRCDGEIVHVTFKVNDQQLGDPVIFTRPEATEIGRQIAKDGYHERFPIGGISTDDVKHFGTRLMLYGLNGE